MTFIRNIFYIKDIIYVTLPLPANIKKMDDEKVYDKIVNLKKKSTLLKYT